MTTIPTGTVTFLFTDIEGSSRRWDSQRAAMERALVRHDTLMRQAVETHHGYVFHTAGDAFGVAFTSPDDAIAAAIAAQRALAAEDWSAVAPGFEPLVVRMGLHTGLAELRDGDYFGPPLNRAARLMSAGHGGQVLLSLVTQQLVRDRLPHGVTLRDLGAHRLKDLRFAEHIYQLVVAGLQDVATPLTTAEALPARDRALVDADFLPPECPYRGLHAFREADASFFFGREAFTELLVEAAAAAPMVGVIGPSGSGKSSVVFAGLVPRLRAASGAGRGGWTVVEMRPGSRPYHALAGALLPLYEGPELTETDRLAEANKLAGYLRDGSVAPRDVLARIGDKHPDLGRLLLVADQFEELYTLCPDEAEHRAFQDLLFAAAFEADGSLPLTLALTLRADFMGHALAYRPFADAIQKHDVKLGPMTRDELGRAIRLPAEKQGRAFESGLVERIVDDVGEKAGTLPLLEFALTKLWEEQSAGWLTHEAYEAIGRVEGAVARHADAVYDALAEPEREPARQVFVQLVQPGEGTEDTRRLATRSEIGVAWPLVRKLADARLVVTSRDEAGSETAEVVHEALIRSWQRLREWMNADRRFRTWQERLRFSLRQWEATGHDEGALLRGAPLGEAEGWLAERGAETTESERAYIADGAALRERDEAEREAQRQRELASARQHADEQARAAHALRKRARWLAGLGAAAGILAVAALVFGQQAAQSARRSQSLALAANSRVLMGDGLGDTALVLALEAATSSPDLPEAELALAEAAYAPGTRLSITGHMTEVHSVAVSPDGRQILSGAKDGGLRLWDAAAGKEIRRFEGHKSVVNTVAFSPDGRYAASGSDDATVGSADTAALLWDVATGRQVRSLTGLTDSVQDLAFTPDGRYLLIASYESATESPVRLWDVATGKLSRRFGDSSCVGLKVAVAADGHRAVTGCTSGSAIIWDLDTGRELHRIKGHATSILCVAISPDGHYVATGSSDQNNNARLWRLDTGDLVHDLRGHSNPVGGLAFTPDSREVLSVASDGTLRVWDVETGAETRRFAGHTAWLTAVAVFPDGRSAATASADGTVRVWYLDNPAQIRRMEGHDGQVESVAFSPDGKRLLTGGQDASARLWDVATGRESQRLIGDSLAVWRVAFSADGSQAATASWHGAVSLWDGATGVLQRRFVESRTWKSRALAFHPGGRWLLSGNDDSVARLWDVRTGESVREFSPGDIITAIVGTPDGRSALVGTSGGALWLWDLMRDGAARRLPLPRDSLIPNVAVSPDGRTGAAGYIDHHLCFFDLMAAAKPNCTEFNTEVRGVDFSPDGKQILIALGSGEVVAWDLQRRALVRRYIGHTDSARGAVFSPDGRLAASVSFDGTARLWRVDRNLGELVAWTLAHRYVADLGCDDRAKFRLVHPCDRDGKAPPVNVYAMHAEAVPTSARPIVSAPVADVRGQPRPVPTGPEMRRIVVPGAVRDVAVGADGQSVLVGTSVGSFRGGHSDLSIVDLGSGKELRRFAVGSSTNALSGLALSPDGRLAASSHGDERIVIWDVASGKAIRRIKAVIGLKGVRFSPDGRTLLAFDHLYDVETGKLVRTFKTAGDLGLSDAFSSDGQYVVTGDNKGLLQQWEVSTGLEVRRLDGHTGMVTSLAAGPGSTIVSGGTDGLVIVWDLASGRTERRLVGHRGPVWGVAISPDGRRVLSAATDGTLRLWDRASGQLTQTFAGHPRMSSEKVDWYGGLAFTPDGRAAVSGGGDGSVIVWEMTGAPASAGEVPVTTVLPWSVAPPPADFPAAPAPGGSVRNAVAGQQHGEIQPGGTELWHFQSPADTVLDIEVRADVPVTGTISAGLPNPPGALDPRLIVRAPGGQAITENDDAQGGTDTGSRIDGLQLTEPGAYGLEVRAFGDRTAGGYTLTITPTRLIRPLRTIGHAIDLHVDNPRLVPFALAIAPDGRRAFVGDITDLADFVPITLLDLDTGTTVRQMDGRVHGSGVHELVFSPDGRRAASCGADTQIVLWDVATGREIRRYLGHTKAIYGLAYSPDGRRLLTGSGDDTAILWDVDTAAILHRFTGHTKEVNQVAFLSDGTSALTGSGDGTAIRWNLDTGEQMGQFNLGRSLNDLAVGPGGKWAVAADYGEPGGTGGSIVQWDLASGAVIRRLPAPAVNRVAISPDGRYVLSVGQDSTVRLWDLPGGREVARLVGHTNLVARAAFTPDGRSAVTTSLDGTVRVWDVAGVVGR